jgi:type I restriction enzyme S subunit
VQYFYTDIWHKEVSMIAVEGARNHGLLNISVSDFFDTIHPIPKSKDTQKEIANLLLTADRKVKVAEKLLNNFENLKSGLLQQMFV